MVKLSEKTMKALKEDILSILYERPLIPLFTYKVAQELRRDNEFTKKLLMMLQKEGLVEEIDQGNRGKFLARRKWKIPQKVLEAMKTKL